MIRRKFHQILILCSVTSVILMGCVQLTKVIPFHREPPVALRDLLVSETALPAGWKAGEVSSIPRGASNDYGDETLQIGFSGPPSLQGQDGAYHLINRFRNPTLAANVYGEMQKDVIFFGETGDHGKHPTDWQYRSPIADDWRFACDSGGCGVIARYDEFISVFSTSMTTPAMTPAALEAALKAIDARIADNLGKKPVATPTKNPK
jgi:hypothetical protein